MRASQDPRLSTAARGVELYRQLVNFHENDLHDVFCFADVVEDFQRDVEDKAVIAIEKDAERVVMPPAQVGHDHFIIERTELVEGEIARLVNREICHESLRRLLRQFFLKSNFVFWYKWIFGGVSAEIPPSQLKPG